MIKSAVALKAKVKNITDGDSKSSQAMIRIFFMERFLERVSHSRYKDQFIIKGGILVSSLIGINLRTTMDIDTSIKKLPLVNEQLEKIIREICDVQLEDNMTFKIRNMEMIMEEFDYPGIRIYIDAMLEKLKQPIKIDISTDDVITPDAIDYKYKLMFEDRYIELRAYNVETLLAEKSQTIISRGLANTRMRDFYDIYEMVQNVDFIFKTYQQAFNATCIKRGTVFSKEQVLTEINKLSKSKEIENMWNRFKNKNYFVDDIEYCEILKVIGNTITKIYE